MTDPIREIEGTWEEVRAHDAELAGRRVRLTILSGTAPEVPAPAGGTTLTARELLKLPSAERGACLEAAAAAAAPLYESDLARPPRERELTALTALDGEDFHDETEGTPTG